MDSPPSIDTVLQALQALYKPTAGDSGSHEKASQWLGLMQKSVYAWHIADQLIQMNKDEESCYFGAQTIRTKIQFAFHELPLESHQSLRDSLLKHCTKINDETKNTIVTQLCLSLADLVVQMASWKSAIADLMQEFGTSRTHWAFLLEFLSVLPEEINSRHLRLGDNRRNEVFDEMTNASAMLVDLLAAVMEAALDDSKTKERVMHCLGSWLSVYAIPQQHLIGSKLLHLPFTIMANHETPIILHNAATECICSALIAVEDLTKNFELAAILYEGVTSLLEPYHMSVAMQDLEKSMNYCRVFTEMAETFLEVMIATPNQGLGNLRTLELLLTCIGHHHFQVADITFNFWNRLSEVLYDENKPVIIAVFRPYVQRLIIALCRLCQYDASQEGLPDEADDFDEFRARAIDLVKDVEFVVGATNIVIQMFETLKVSAAPGSTWQVAEAAIFIMAAVAKYIDLTEESAVPQVILGITGQHPGTSLAVLHSSMNLIGEFSKWINVHPQSLEPSLKFLLQGLQNQKLSTIAAESIQKLCSACSEHMVSQFSGLLQVVQAIDTLNVTLSAGLGLLKACSLILARLSYEEIQEGVRQLCILQVEPLNKILSLGDIRVNRDEKQSDPSVWLDRLSVIFRYTVPSVPEGKVHPAQDAIQQVWPVLGKCFQKYGGDVRITERSCRCVRYAVRCLGKKSTVLLNPVLSLIMEQYQHHLHSCYLYLGSVLVDEYGLEPTCFAPLLTMLQALSTSTFKMLEERDGLRNHPNTVDDLFQLTTRFMQTMPIDFLQSPIARSIFLCGIASVSIHHRDANESVAKYFLEFIRHCNILQNMQKDVELMSNGPVDSCMGMHWEEEGNKNNSNGWRCLTCNTENKDNPGTCAVCGAQRYLDLYDMPSNWVSGGVVEALTRLKAADLETKLVKKIFDGSDSTASLNGICCPIKLGDLAKPVIQKVVRNESPRLYRSYRLQCIQMELDRLNLNEKYLIHGTTETSALSICKTGFNKGFIGRNGATYGVGTYFATVVGHALAYATPNAVGEKVIILTRVLCGESCAGDDSLKALPAAPLDSEFERFTTAVDSTENPSIYAIFDDHDCYPEYLIYLK